MCRTFTDEQDVVVAEAHRTLTAEAPDLIDTHSVGTDAGDLPALINICTKHTPDIMLNERCNSSTFSTVFTGCENTF